MAMLAAMATGGRRRNAASAPTSGTVTFTQAIDTVLSQATPTTDLSAGTTLNVDTDDPPSSGNAAQTLIRFDNLFGNTAGRIPLGSSITSAQLELTTTNAAAAGNGASVHRMLQSWSATDTWNSRTAGVSADGTEAVTTADLTIDSAAIGTASYNVTSSVQAWSDGAANYGWVFRPRGSDGWAFYSAEGTTPPKLTVTYAPAATLTPAFSFDWASSQTGATVARSTTGTRINASGVRESIAANTARYDYSPLTGNAFLGVLVETAAATNLLANSGDTTTASWLKQNATSTAAGGTGMGGTNTLQTITANGAGGANLQQQNFAITSGATLTATIYVKKGTGTWIFVGILNSSYAGTRAWFDLATTATGQVQNGTDIIGGSSSIRLLSNGIHELTVTCNTSGLTSAILQLHMDTGNGGYGTVASGTTFFFDSAQVQVGGSATTYFPTTTAAAARAAETLTVAGTNGTYDILVVDAAGAEWRDDVVVTGSSYAVAPRSGQRHVQRVSAYAAGLSDTQKNNIYSGAGTVTPPPDPDPEPTGSYTTMFHTVKTSGDTAGYGTRIFYISNSGNNSNNGTSTATPWLDWSKVASSAGSFQAGDRILFQRGGTFTTTSFNGMQIAFSGSAAAPIVIGAYGSGNPPQIMPQRTNFTSGADSEKWDTAFEITSTSRYIQISDLKITTNIANNISECGIRSIGRNITVSNVEIEKMSQGLVIYSSSTGPSDLIMENCYVHDLTMQTNTNDGSQPGNDDDYGCIGVHVKSSNVTIRKNTFKNMIASSFDYDIDGSIIEILPVGNGAGNVSNILIQNNYCENTVGFTEIGGNADDTVTNIVFDHNIIVDVYGVIYFHNGVIGTLTGVKFTNNTVYSRINDTVNAASSVYGFRNSNGSFFTSQNNIFDIGKFDYYDFNANNYTRSNNLYYLGTTTNVRSDLTTPATEYSGNPLFVNAAGRDFRLTASSPALNRAVALTGYLTDYSGNDLSGRSNLDIGALEYFP